jgi:hypothetical protein
MGRTLIILDKNHPPNGIEKSIKLVRNGVPFNVNNNFS